MLISTEHGFFNADDLTDCTLEEARADRLAQIHGHAYRLRETAVKGVHPAEMASWSLKASQAAAGGGFLLDLEASQRGVPVAVVVARVLANAQALSALEAIIAGVAGRHSDAIRALTSVEDVLAYDFQDGWPAAVMPT
jgi:hypothetical protein